MVDFIKNWASGIIVAVIIATLIEMILPENKNKKYIKTVIGVYILFTIISPIISNALVDGKLDVSKYESYLKIDESYNELSTEFKIDNTDNVQKIYQDQIESDIQTKLKIKGFIVEILNLEIITENEDEYGALESIELLVMQNDDDKKEEKSKTTNEIQIDKIEIGNTIDQTQQEEIQSSITEKKKDEIKEYLQEEYGIKQENIKIQ